MNLDCDTLQQLAALEALGALDGAEAEQLRPRLQRDTAARAEWARFRDTAAALAVARTLPLRRPSSAARARVLERIGRTPQLGAPTRATEESPAPPGMRFVAHDAPWMPAPIAGGRFKLLSGGPQQAYVMLLIELGAGAVYPEHDHHGFEDMYVLSGDLQTEGRSLGPGDFLHAEPGSHHHELRSLHGCTAIMVVPREALAVLGRP